MVIAKGTCFPLFAYDVGRAIDLDTAARQVLLADAARQTIKHKRRAPAYFEYRPAPLGVGPRGGHLRLRRGLLELRDTNRWTARGTPGARRGVVGERASAGGLAPARGEAAPDAR